MIQAHIIDTRGVYIGTQHVDAYAAQPPGAVYAELPEAQPGKTRMYIGGAWTQVPDAEVPPLPEPPPAPVPQSVSRAQGKAALITQGLWGAVTGFVASIEDDTQRALAEVALNDTQEWRRDSPFLAQAAQALSLDDAALDALFIAAAEVQL